MENNHNSLIYRLDPVKPIDNSEILLLGGAGRYTMAALRHKAARESTDLASELSLISPSYRAVAHMISQLNNTVDTIRQAISEINSLTQNSSKSLTDIDENTKLSDSDPVSKLEDGLRRMVERSDVLDYKTINQLMMMVSAYFGITPHELHTEFNAKHGETPDDWANKLSSDHQHARMLDEAIQLESELKHLGKLRWVGVTKGLMAKGYDSTHISAAVDAAIDASTN